MTDDPEFNDAQRRRIDRQLADQHGCTRADAEVVHLSGAPVGVPASITGALIEGLADDITAHRAAVDALWRKIVYSEWSVISSTPIDFEFPRSHSIRQKRSRKHPPCPRWRTALCMIRVFGFG
ncbi:MAG TPA: hypothetical protein VLS27_18830 [Gammaproteobacteria bacterium]|nr:hypothetical protein [Gammaproteobacteria bacterium]